MNMDDYMSVAEVAETLGVLQETVRRAVYDKRLKAERPKARMLLILRSDVDEYMARTRPNGQRPTGRPKGSLDRGVRKPRTARHED